MAVGASSRRSARPPDHTRASVRTHLPGPQVRSAAILHLSTSHRGRGSERRICNAGRRAARSPPTGKRRGNTMGQGSGIREVAWVDIAGGGQVVLDGNYAYVGHMQPPHGTSVLDLSDPAPPRVIARVDRATG